MASGTSGMSQKITELTEKLEKSCLEVEKLRDDYNEICSKTLEMRKEKIKLEHQVEEQRVQYDTAYLTKTSEKLEVRKKLYLLIY